MTDSKSWAQVNIRTNLWDSFKELYPDASSQLEDLLRRAINDRKPKSKIKYRAIQLHNDNFFDVRDQIKKAGTTWARFLLVCLIRGSKNLIPEQPKSKQIHFVQVNRRILEFIYTELGMSIDFKNINNMIDDNLFLLKERTRPAQQYVQYTVNVSQWAVDKLNWMMTRYGLQMGDVIFFIIMYTTVFFKDDQVAFLGAQKNTVKPRLRIGDVSMLNALLGIENFYNKDKEFISRYVDFYFKDKE